MIDSIRLIGAAVLTLVLAAGCQTRETEEREVAGGEEQAAVRAMEDRGGAAGTADARQDIDAVNQRWQKAALAGDAAGVASLYTDDAVLMVPGAPRAEGRAAIESRLAAVFEAGPVSSMTIETDAVTLSESGELAYDVGTYTMAGKTPTGEAWQDKGKYLGVLKNVGGQWKLVADIWNSDTAPTM